MQTLSKLARKTDSNNHVEVMDDSEKFEKWLRRTVRLIGTMGLRRVREAKIGDFILFVQTVVAALMLYSLWQAHDGQKDTREIIELTKRQVDSTIKPTVTTMQFNTNVFLFNRGSVDVMNVTIAGISWGWACVLTNGGHSHSIANATAIHGSFIAKYLPSGGEVSIDITSPEFDLNNPFVDDLFSPPPSRDEATNRAPQLICFLLSYERAADNKPFHEFLYFSRARKKPMEYEAVIGRMSKEIDKSPANILHVLEKYPVTLYYDYPAPERVNGDISESMAMELSAEQKSMLKKTILNLIKSPELNDRDDSEVEQK